MNCNSDLFIIFGEVAWNWKGRKHIGCNHRPLGEKCENRKT